MDTKRIQKPVSQFKKNIAKQIKVDQIILFGSRLEGSETADSDIDLVVVSDDFQNMSEDDRMFLLYKARRKINPEVHPWAFTKKELQAASPLTTLGHARDHGYRFL